MAASEGFQAVFEQFRAILKQFEPQLVVQHDTPDTYYLNTPYTEKYKKELFFGAAQVKKNYVSYYLMPVYMFPDLLEEISPELRARMQGKSCFNFRKIEPQQLAELEQLSHRGLARLKKEGLLP
jgi:hypothetical protein